MNAAQDKVHGILETLLEESVPLIHKGIFTTEELQQAMNQRSKHENNMLRSSYKLSDYLKAIEFEYALQRDRRHKISTLALSNPLFKKQSKTDFIILKRIIRLWDRTTHKYKYNVDLWKQYLGFCIEIQSKKHFYKALSAAIRMIPHNEDLWMIGVQYEVEIGKNLWKARKILMRGLKLNPKSESMWLKMLEFEVFFVKTLYMREKAIRGQQQPMKFITGSNIEEEDEQLNIGEQMIDENEEHAQSDGINLEKHDQVMLIVIQEAVSKFEERQTKLDILFKMLRIVEDSINQQKQRAILAILKRLHNNVMKGIPSSDKQRQNQIIPQNKTTSSVATLDQKIQNAKRALNRPENIHTSEVNKIITPFINKPKVLSELLVPVIEKNYNFMIQYISSCSVLKNYGLPAEILGKLLEHRTQGLLEEHVEYLKKQIRNVANDSLKYTPRLLENIIKFNKQSKNYKANNDIHRKLSIACRNEPQIIEKCLYLIHSN